MTIDATLHRRVEADEPDAERAAFVRPADWRNPDPAPAYDLVVLGGGTAGLVAAMGAAGLGARVALAERSLLGGDCLNTGCVPSKALIRSARAVGEIAAAPSVGVAAGPAAVDFAAVMARMRRRRAAIAANDAAVRLQRAGVDVFFGDAAFADDRHVAVDGRRLRFTRAVIATGGRPATPPVPGLDAVRYHTNETIFSLTTLPRRLLVIGSGPIGCELAQAFARFGSQVTMIGRARQLLPRESPDAAGVVARAFEADGVRCRLGATVERVERDGDAIVVHHAGGATETGDALLVATGRAPNIEGLNLAAAGIDADRHGVAVDDRLRTTNRRVYASGDVCSKFKFTHAADAMSRLVIQNALFFGRKRLSDLVIPWVTFTDPEVAHVGVSHGDVESSGGRLAAVTVPLDEVDRSVVDDETDGFVRLYHEGGTIRGCTIVAPHAGEMIGEVAYAMNRQGTLSALSATIHPYPTVAEALRKAGDAYRRQALTPGVMRWLARYFRWTR